MLDARLVAESSDMHAKGVREALRGGVSRSDHYGCFPSQVLAPPDRDLHRPGGFCSQITAGSNLSLKVPRPRRSAASCGVASQAATRWPHR